MIERSDIMILNVKRKQLRVMSVLRRPKGVLLILFGLLIFALIGISALVVDFGWLSDARNRNDSYVKLVGLAALHGYFENLDEPILANRIERARERAEDAIRRQASYHATGDKMELLTVVKSPAGGGPAGAGDLLLEPGHWRFISGKYSFVKENDWNVNRVNSFRISGRLPIDRKSVFAQIFGKQAISTGVNIVASAVPRRTIVLVDISESTIRQTHTMRLPADQLATPEQGHGSHYSLLPRATTMDALGYLGHNAGILYTPYDANTASLSQTLVLQNASLAVRGAGPYTINRHFLNDYFLVRGYRDSDRSGASVCSRAIVGGVATCPFALPTNIMPYAGDVKKGSKQFSYLVDRFPGMPLGDYRGPQPLSDIFRSLHSLVEIFDERAIGGDRMGIVFYDNNFMWSRIIRPNNKWALMKFLTDFDDKTAGGSWEFMMGLGLYPGAIPQKALEGPFSSLLMNPPFTDSFGALRVARQLLLDDTADPVTADSVVMIGDGLTNCVPNAALTATTCNNDYPSHANAITRAKQYVATDYIPRGVPVHVVIFGDDTAPHTLLLKDPTKTGGECLDDASARISGKVFVRGLASDSERAEIFPIRTEANPYYQVNSDMYEIASLSGGIWAPVRRAAPDGAFTPTCDALSPETAPRLIYDPQARSVEDQITDYMEEMMRDNPYIVVNME